MESGALGKKVFFLYPPPVLAEVIESLAKEEFEVYLVYDQNKLRRYLESAPESIVFVNLDSGLDEAGWLGYVDDIRKHIPAVGLGVVVLNDNAELREHYLMNVGIQCGFVILKLGAAKTAEILAKTLEANEARGRRKFVRADCSPGLAQAAFDYEGATLRASLTDLSSAGMALVFENGASLRVGTVLRDIALSIKGQRLAVSGVIVAKRDEDTAPIHVIMFSPASLDDDKRDRLRTIVCKINQASLEVVLEKL